MKKKSFLLAAVVVAALFSACGDNEKTKHEVSISFSGAFALYPLAQTWAEEYNKIHPEIRFDIQAGGAGKGLTDCLTGAVDIGMFSREITDAEKAKGVWWIALCKDAVIPTINSQNHYIDSITKRGLTKEEFKSIFIDQRPSTWDSLFKVKTTTPHRINVYTRADAAGAADSWASFFGKKQEDLKGVGVSGDPGVADAVRKDRNSIGYNNTLFVFDNTTGQKLEGIDVACIDINENGKIDADENVYKDLPTFLEAVNTGKYPAPPARSLYFLTKGKSQKKEVLDFFEWVLTDGQKLVRSSGYVPLQPDVVKEQLNKLVQ